MGGGDPNRRHFLEQPSDVLIPETGAAPYWYVDPRAPGQPAYQQQQREMDIYADENEQLVNLLEALKRMGLTPEDSSGQQPNIQF